MGFWVGLVAFLVICVIVVHYLPEKYQHIVPKLMMVVLTFFSAFRYEIGADYNVYVMMFDSVTISSSMEPFYTFVVIILRTVGFDVQMVFVVYSILTSFFIWRGLSVYIRNYNMLALAILFYAIVLGGWSASLSIIRQSLAVAIFLWGSQYIIRRKLKKYILVCIIMGIVHYTASILLFVYFLPYEKIKKIHLYCVLLLGLCIAYGGVLPEILSLCSKFMGEFGYLRYIGFKGLITGSGITYLFYCVVWLFIVYVWEVKDREDKVVRTIYSLYVFSLIIFSFSEPLCRIRHYFELFFIVSFFKAIFDMQIIYKKIVVLGLVICYSAIFFVTISRIENNAPDPIRKNNINYQFNFQLTK